jgi:hypothetical protein
VWHWFLQVTGTDNEAGKRYALSSGFGTDLGEGATPIASSASTVVMTVRVAGGRRSRLVWVEWPGPATRFVSNTYDRDHAALKEQHRIRHAETHEHLARGD